MLKNSSLKQTSSWKTAVWEDGFIPGRVRDHERMGEKGQALCLWWVLGRDHRNNPDPRVQLRLCSEEAMLLGRMRV